MKETISYLATDLSLDPETGFIGFADKITEHYFWMQPSETSTSKDEIWLERDDQAWGGNGATWNIVLSRTLFIINTRELNWMACEAIQIEYAATEADFSLLKSLLQNAMIECPNDLTIQD